MSDSPNSPLAFGPLSRRRVLQLGGATVAAIGLGPLLAACGDSSSSSGVPKSDAKSVAKIKEFLAPYDESHSGKGLTLDIGLMLPFSGSGSYFGRVMAAGAKLGVKHIEALGGPKFNLV